MNALSGSPNLTSSSRNRRCHLAVAEKANIIRLYEPGEKMYTELRTEQGISANYLRQIVLRLKRGQTLRSRVGQPSKFDDLGRAVVISVFALHQDWTNEKKLQELKAQVRESCARTQGVNVASILTHKLISKRTLYRYLLRMESQAAGNRPNAEAVGNLGLGWPTDTVFIGAFYWIGHHHPCDIIRNTHGPGNILLHSSPPRESYFRF